VHPFYFSNPSGVKHNFLLYRSSILNNNLNITARPEIVYYNQLNADYTEKCFKLKLVLLWYRLHFFHIHYCWYKQFWLKNEDIYQLINLYNNSYVTTQTWNENQISQHNCGMSSII